MGKKRGRPRDWNDDEILNLVWQWRVANGACTLDDLGRATGMSTSGIHRRVQTLIAEGRLTRSATSGSIRASNEVLMEQLPDGRLIGHDDRARA